MQAPHRPIAMASPLPALESVGFSRGWPVSYHPTNHQGMSVSQKWVCFFAGKYIVHCFRPFGETKIQITSQPVEMAVRRSDNRPWCRACELESLTAILQGFGMKLRYNELTHHHARWGDGIINL
jgi:hypothetical protein